MIGLTVIAAGETEQLTLWIWQAAFRSHTPEPVRQLPVMLPGMLRPTIPVGGYVLHRVFARYTRLWRVQYECVFI